MAKEATLQVRMDAELKEQAEEMCFLTHDKLIPFYNENCIMAI